MEENATNKTCRYCGKELPQEAIFCYYCRRELVTRPERPSSESQSGSLDWRIVLAISVAIILVIILIIFL